MQPFLSLSAAALIAAISGCFARQEPDTVAPPASSPTLALAANPLASFERMMTGRWNMTALAGTSTFDTWHWGPGKRSIRKMTEGTAPSGEPWHGISVFYWHPGRKEVRKLSVSPAFRGVSEGTFTFDGEKADGLVDMHQTIGHRVFGLRWTFEGPDTYHDELLDKVPEGFSLQNEWRRFRVAAASEDERAAERTRAAAAKPSEFLKPIARLLGHTWEGMAVPEVATQPPPSTLRTRTSFEYVPDADAIYGRVQTLNADGTPSRTMDLYLYHHTGAGVLRCLALASDGAGEGIVYEGDITPVDDGRAIKIALKEHRASGTAALEARIDFEQSGVVLQRVWLIDHDHRTLIADLRHLDAGN